MILLLVKHCGIRISIELYITLIARLQVVLVFRNVLIVVTSSVVIIRKKLVKDPLQFFDLISKSQNRLLLFNWLLLD